MTLLAFLVALFASFFGRLLGEDSKFYIPKICEALLRKSATKIHEEISCEVLEEWLAHLDETEELTAKLWHSFSIYFWGASLLAQEIGRSEVASARIEKTRRVRDAGFALLLVGPLLIALSVAVATTGRSPFVVQERIGLGDRIVRIWRLRTMLPNEEDSCSRCIENNFIRQKVCRSKHRLDCDHLSIPFGGFMQATGLDELPMFFSVLNGQMSLIGPKFIDKNWFKENLLNRSHQLTPGFVSPSDVYCSGMSLLERARLDECYFEKQTIRTDISLLTSLPFAVSKESGA